MIIIGIATVYLPYQPHRVGFIQSQMIEPRKAPVKQWKDHTVDQQARVNGRITQIRRLCGQLCDTTRAGTDGPFFKHVTAPVNCPSLLASKLLDMPRETSKAPHSIPVDWFSEFTKIGPDGGKMDVSTAYFDQKYLGGNAMTAVWTESMINALKAQAEARQLKGTYTQTDTNQLIEGMEQSGAVRGGRVLVVGSEQPWVEAAALAVGATRVDTLEFGKIESQHTQVFTFTPSEFRAYTEKNGGELYDAIISFSSVEHTGLGRYGDALNPWGDIMAVAQMWCMAKPGGALVIGVPYCDKDECDQIAFNAHREYGKTRYSYLTTNWNQKWRSANDELWQRVHVFSK